MSSQSNSSANSNPPAKSSAPSNAPESSENPSKQQIDSFIDSLDNFQPSIPPSLVNHYLTKSGLATSDKKTLNLISLATQKFLSDICSDALHYLPKDKKRDKGKFVLRGEHLEKCLENYGVDVRKRRFFVEEQEEEK